MNTFKNKKELSEAAKIINNFVSIVPGGCSYWLDEEGRSHTADMGYVCEFLEDLLEYLELETS